MNGMSLSRCLLLMSIWYGGKGRKTFVVGLSFDQCQLHDSLFKRANIELVVTNTTNTTGWIEKVKVTSSQQCANRCHHLRPKCKSVTIDESNTCLIFDINRYSVKAKFRTNTSFSYFERYECPPQQQQVPTTVFPGVPGQVAAGNNDDIRYKKFVAVQRRAKSCKDLYNRFNYRESGLYAVNIGDDYLHPIECDMTTRNGGWTVVERRKNGDVSFDVEWDEFKWGFGDFNSEYYYGNENWHLLTTEDVKHELYLILETASGVETEVSYDDVSIGPESDRYRLALGTYIYISGVDLGAISLGDKFKQKNDGKIFSARDLDTTDDQCTNRLTGGFWFGNVCGNVNLHGLWGRDTLRGIKWRGLTGNNGGDSFRKVTILIR